MAAGAAYRTGTCSAIVEKMRVASSEVNWMAALNQIVKPSDPSSECMSVKSDPVSDWAGHHCISQHMPAEQMPSARGGRFSQSASRLHFLVGEVQLPMT